ncbi:MAG: hypothetical protein ACKOYN_07935 [Planctomycetota bacterium]
MRLLPISALLSVLAFLAPACTTGPEIPPAASAARKPLVIGFWTSELDGTTLDLRENGSFTVVRVSREGKPEAQVEGWWRMEGEELRIVNAEGAASCAGVEGSYTAEVVRDTARFALVRDECEARERHMAWPWKRDTRR